MVGAVDGHAAGGEAEGGAVGPLYAALASVSVRGAATAVSQAYCVLYIVLSVTNAS